MRKLTAILMSLVVILTGSKLSLPTEAHQKTAPQQVLSDQQASNQATREITSPVEPLLASSTSTLTAPDGYTLQYIGRYSSVSTISDGMIAVSTGDYTDPTGNWGFVDATTGKEVIRPQYRVWLSGILPGTGLRFSDGRLSMLTDKGSIVIDKTGKVIVPAGRYEEITPYDNGVAYALDNRGWHLIDKDGKEIFTSNDRIYLTFEPQSLRGGLAQINMINADSTVSSSIIDLSGKSVLPFSKTSEYMIRKNGVIRVRDFSGSKIETYYVDKTGTRVANDPGSEGKAWKEAHECKLSNEIKRIIKYHDVYRFYGPEYYDIDFLKELSEQFRYITPVEDGVALVGKFVNWVHRSPLDPSLNGFNDLSRPLCDWYILRPIN